MKIGLEPNAGDGGDGFTLIETLVAFLILSISLAILTQSVMQATTQIRTADVSVQARQLATRIIAAARSPASKESKAEGFDDATGLSWGWARKPIERSDDAGVLRPLVLISVWIAAGAEPAPIYTVKTLAYGEPEI